jgi:hypothetical protein
MKKLFDIFVHGTIARKADRVARHYSISIIEAVNFHPRDRSWCWEMVVEMVPRGFSVHPLYYTDG